MLPAADLTQPYTTVIPSHGGAEWHHTPNGWRLVRDDLPIAEVLEHAKVLPSDTLPAPIPLPWGDGQGNRCWCGFAEGSAPLPVALGLAAAQRALPAYSVRRYAVPDSTWVWVLDNMGATLWNTDDGEPEVSVYASDIWRIAQAIPRELWAAPVSCPYVDADDDEFILNADLDVVLGYEDDPSCVRVLSEDILGFAATMAALGRT